LSYEGVRDGVAHSSMAQQTRQRRLNFAPFSAMNQYLRYVGAILVQL